MFSTLLSGVQTALTGLISKNFTISALFPAMLFLAINAGMFHLIGIHVFETLTNSVKGLSDFPNSAAYLIGMLTALGLAYFLTSLATTMMETLEGKHLPGPLRALLHMSQYRKVNDLNRQIDQAKAQMTEYVVALKPPPAMHRSSLFDDLDKAEQSGLDQKHCVYSASAGPGSPRASLDELERQRDRGEPIPFEKIHPVAKTVIQCLGASNSALPDDAGASALATDHQRLRSLLNYSRDHYKHQLLQLSNLKQFSYPGGVGNPRDQERRESSSVNVLAPTQFGNIGRTMRSYAITRYSLDLDLFWTRLQRSIQNGGSTDKFFQVLSEGKAQVDFFVAMTFLAAVFTVAWMTVLFIKMQRPGAFLAVALLGPVAMYTFYILACQSYRVFADLIRTGVDTYRFQLLSDLKVPMPAGSREEQDLWELLGGRTGYDTKADLMYTQK